MGLNQSTVGVWKNNSLINLHLLTGQIGRAGAGPFSLTGQPNAMGGREGGLLCHQLPGYRFVEDAEHRRAVEGHWGRPAGTIAATPGLTAVEMFRALETGRLKAIWIAATNPAVSLPDLHHVRRALAKAELVVVSDAYHPTETTRYAHVLLPAAQWAEKHGTSTSSERLVSRSEPVVNPPGAALPDWEILARFGREMGFEGFAFKTAAEVWDEFAPLTAGRPCDMAGMTSARLARERHLRWPCPTVDHPGTERLYEDLRFPTPDGRARLLPRPHQSPRETVDHEFPLVLTTGRLYAHWHTLTRTGKSPKLVQREPGAFVAVHPDDASAAGLSAGMLAEVASRRGVLRLPVRLDPGLRPGVVFIPFHWGDQHGEETAANYLTISAIGRVAKQPEFKYCAISLAPAFDAPEPIAEPRRNRPAQAAAALGNRFTRRHAEGPQRTQRIQNSWVFSSQRPLRPLRVSACNPLFPSVHQGPTVSPETPADDPTARTRVLVLSTLAFTLMFNVWLMLGVLGVPIKKAMGLSDSQAEWLLAAAILSGALFRLNFGIWADRFGGKRVMVGLLFATAIPCYLLAFASTYPQLIACALLFGLAGNSFSVGIAWNSAWFPRRRGRGRRARDLRRGQRGRGRHEAAGRPRALRADARAGGGPAGGRDPRRLARDPGGLRRDARRLRGAHPRDGPFPRPGPGPGPADGRDARPAAIGPRLAVQPLLRRRLRRLRRAFEPAPEVLHRRLRA